jgi:hypothetical protein
MQDLIGDPSHPMLDRAEYIERMTQELSRLASAGNLTLLAFILDMATEEAASVRNSGRIRLAPEGAPDRRPRPALNGER